MMDTHTHKKGENVFPNQKQRHAYSVSGNVLKSCGDGNISRRNTQVCAKRMLEWLHTMKMNRKENPAVYKWILE